MTARKPPGVTWESWIDKQVEEGRARGDFENLPGIGKPIEGLDQPRDELWWVRDKLKREGIEYLPPSLAIRRDADVAKAQALRAPSEREARRILDEINQRIRYLNSHMVEGPPTTLMPLDTEALLTQWRETHPGRADRAAPPAAAATPPTAASPGARSPLARVRARLRRR